MYWDFLGQHRARLAENPRMRALLSNLDKMSPADRAEVHATAEAHRDSLTPATGYTFDDDAG